MQTAAVFLLILGVGYSLADESCSVSPNDRNDCGWYGIDQETCEGRGCCYDDTDFGFETKYCFYPTGHKCYGIAPEERKDCGYYGIQREECESEGCCFDHTVPDVPWCFHGGEPAVPGEATVPPTEEEEGTESVPEEGTESPGAEGEEEPEPETAVPGEATVPPTEAEEGTESVPEEGTESPGE